MNSTKKQKISNMFSFFTRKTNRLEKPPVQLYTKINSAEVEILKKHFYKESMLISSESIGNLLRLNKSHIKRLTCEERLINDIENIEIPNSIFPWGRNIKESIENLDETLGVFHNERFEPIACLYLTRSIVHLINLYETINEISKVQPEHMENIMFNYLNVAKKCISGFQIEFNKFCREITNYITEFKKTLNLLVIYRISDIEELYNYSLEMTNMLNTDTPENFTRSIYSISNISNDINDTKTDLINIKHHQDKDKNMKYV
jgi:hypothetical protein